VDVKLGTFRIMGLIAHEVPIRGSDGATGPILSEVETPLQPEWRNYFRERVTESLNRSFEVEFTPDISSPVPELLKNYFISQTKFVAMSQDVATHLYASQSRRNPSGLLVITRGQIEQDDKTVRALAILKLEKESGIRATQTKYEGKRTFAIEHLRDLMLTEKTKVFKAALFHESDDEPICSHVSDNQLGYQPTTEIAAFFLRFLGCKSKQDAQVATKRFLQASERFINGMVQDPRHQTRYYNALLSELQSEKRLIVPATFAQEHLAVHDRSKYLEWIGRAGLSDNSFIKDVTLVKGVMGQTEVRLTNGIAIAGPPADFDRLVHLTTGQDGAMKIEVEGEVAKVRGRGKDKSKVPPKSKQPVKVSGKNKKVATMRAKARR
jgi:37-kD nucleoid-associated bacterial protein